MERYRHVTPCALLLLLFCMTDHSIARINKTLISDQYSLLAFKSRMTNSNILRKNWTSDTPVCTWIGVSCGSRHRRVTAIDLSGMSLDGNIPPEIGNISFLVSLNMSGNFLNGTLPKELANLHRLQALDLSHNNITGNIPEEFGNLFKMEILDLGFNELTGPVPLPVFNLSFLKILSLTNNSLSESLPSGMCSHGRGGALRELLLSLNIFYGEIPSSLYLCSQLQIINLASNNFIGQVPREIGNLTMLERLYLGQNSLSGTTPEEISNLRNLKILGMELNNLSGFFPLGIFNISSIQYISLYKNYNIRGSLPSYIGNLTMLNTLYLHLNSFTGVIPQEIGFMYGLKVLYLAGNSFSGSIPPGIFNMSQLVHLNLASNLLSGNLSTTFSFNLPNLITLYLAVNSFTGPILKSLTNFTMLAYLYLSYNQFTEAIPNSLGDDLRLLQILNVGFNNFTRQPLSTELTFLTHLTACTFLRELTLHANPLEGSLPKSIGNFSKSLQFVGASTCMIKGRILNEIGNLSKLWYLSLSHNELLGPIPTTFLGLTEMQRLYLNNNQLEGAIPESLCTLQNLGEFYLRSNQLSGSIPECLGDVTSLRNLDLSSNGLNASIPENFWNLTDLLELDLSSNSLSGTLSPAIGKLEESNYTIPSTIGRLQNLVNLSLANNQFYGSIPESMSNMLSLKLLDLSQNNLSGVIPRYLENLTELIYFNVSSNDLSGEIPSEGSFRNLSYLSFMFNKDLCGAPRFNVPPCPKDSRHTPKGKKKLKIVLISIGIAVAIVGFIVVLVLMRYKKKQRDNVSDVLSPLVEKRISYYELQQATDGFNEINLLGIGGFGSVFKGVLGDGTILAVKVFNLQVEGALKSFDAECEVLRNIRHRNLTKVISSCSNESFKALLLDYMPNGSLERWLYSHNCFLDISQRLDTMIDVASALEYLHHGYGTSVVHCDLKPSNILLNEDMVAHVSDFGMAKLLAGEDSMTLTRTLATLGYMAPEYGLEGTISPRCDVYSYGILLMEVFMRMKPSDEKFGGELTMRSWVQHSLPDDIHLVVDANLLDPNEHHYTGKLNCLISLMEIAINCTVESPRERPTMKDALVALKKIKLRLVAYIAESHRQGQVQRP